MSDIRSELLSALELDKDGDWDAAHRIVQRIEDTNAYRVHAYLHRKEGDLNNANYWYDRAHEEMPDCSLGEEWTQLKGEIDKS